MNSNYLQLSQKIILKSLIFYDGEKSNNFFLMLSCIGRDLLASQMSKSIANLKKNHN